jgi:hypothetical protein
MKCRDRCENLNLHAVLRVKRNPWVTACQMVGPSPEEGSRKDQPWGGLGCLGI